MTLPKPLREFDLESFFFKFRWPITFLLIGIIFVGVGLFLAKGNLSENKVEILESATQVQTADSEIIIEVSGAVEKPGVFRLKQGSRVEDVLILAGGVSANADRAWMDKVLNRAAKLIDGQKIYIPSENEQTEVLSANNGEDIKVYQSQSGGRGSGLINVNTASAKELESLWGIGPVYAQNIIEQRPYSSIEELLTRKIIKKNVYERNKDKLTVY